MSIFNEEQLKAMFSREYICHECGHLMEFEDEWEDTLVCPHCGHSIDLDDYGREGNEEYENLYPTREEVLGIANDDSEEDSDLSLIHIYRRRCHRNQEGLQKSCRGCRCNRRGPAGVLYSLSLIHI